MSQDNTTILLDIYERLGKIETKLESVEKHEERIVVLEKFEGRISQYLWAAGAFISGVLFFLWKGIEYWFEGWLKTFKG